MIEIIPSTLDIEDQSLLVDNPVPVDQIVYKIEKGFWPLKQVVRNNPVAMSFLHSIDVPGGCRAHLISFARICWVLLDMASASSIRDLLSSLEGDWVV